MCTYARAHLWKSEDKLQESILSFGHMGPTGQILVISLDGSLLHLLSHLDGPLLCVHVWMRVHRWVEVYLCVHAEAFTGVFKNMNRSEVNTKSSSITIYFTHWDKSLKNHKTQNPQNSQTRPLWLASFPRDPPPPLQGTVLHECQRSKSSPHWWSHLCCPHFVHMWMWAGIVLASVHTRMYSMEPEVNLRQWFLAIIHFVFWDKVSHISGTYQLAWLATNKTQKSICLPPHCWDDKCIPIMPRFVVLGGVWCVF